MKLKILQRRVTMSSAQGKTIEYDKSHDLLTAFRRNAEKRPDNIAVVFHERTYTYAELDRLSDLAAAALLREGVTPGEFVCVMMEREIDYPTAVLGIMKAGAAYVPVDPLYPEDRRDYMRKDCHAKVTVTKDFLEKAKKEEPVSTVPFTPDPESPAYMIYTSGSTGRPKGVIIPHRAVTALAAWLIPELGLDETKRNLCVLSFSFDASTLDLLYPLMAGGQIHILDGEEARNTGVISGYIKSRHITGMSISMALGLSLLNNCDVDMEYMMLGGEKLTSFRRTPTRIYNGYGPTEFTVTSSFHLVNQEKDRDIPIGRPVPNTWSFICDENGYPVPDGEIGEICLVGPQLALGYFGQEEKTKKAFVKIPFAHSFPYDLMYKTGDLGKYNEDGELEFCGRIDHQVKLRGFRIEMGEIESAASHVSGVGLVAAEVKNNRLCLYYVGEPDLEPQIREECRKKLASYMVPDAIMRLDSFPMTPNGKVDRKLLPVPAVSISAEDIVAPVGTREKILLSIAREVLSFDGFGVTDSLSQLGMSSLHAVEIAVRARKQNLLLKVGDILSRDNIRDISKDLMSVVSWYAPYDASKKNMVLSSGIFAEKYNLPRMKMWSARYNILFIEPVDEHYIYIFRDADYNEVVEFYYALVKYKLEEVSDLSIDLAGGFCFGGLLAYSLAERYYADTGKKPRVFLGDTAVSYIERAADGKNFSEETADAAKDLRPSLLSKKTPEMSDEDFEKLVEDHAVLMAQKFMIAKKVSAGSIAHKGPFDVLLYNCTADKDKTLYPGQWNDVAGSLTVINIEDDHFSFCMDPAGKYRELLSAL